MTERQVDISSLDRFGPEVRRAALLLLAGASHSEHADPAAAVTRVLELPDVHAVLEYLARLSFIAMSHVCGSSDAALQSILDEIDVADFRITMPDAPDPEDPSIPMPDIVGRLG